MDMGGIWLSLPLLRAGCCYQVGAQSKLRIFSDSWLHKLNEFRPSEPTNLPLGTRHMQNLMDKSGRNWDVQKVTSIFPPHISSIILHTLILESEQDRLVWVPSTTWAFTVKSSYSLLIQDRLSEHSTLDKATWGRVWKTNLYGRYNILLWRLLSNAFPTLDRIAKFLPNTCDTCYLCGEERESLKHLTITCPIIKILWGNSPWQIRIVDLNQLEVPPMDRDFD